MLADQARPGCGAVDRLGHRALRLQPPQVARIRRRARARRCSSGAEAAAPPCRRPLSPCRQAAALCSGWLPRCSSSRSGPLTPLPLLETPAGLYVICSHLWVSCWADIRSMRCSSNNREREFNSLFICFVLFFVFLFSCFKSQLNEEREREREKSIK